MPAVGGYGRRSASIPAVPVPPTAVTLMSPDGRRKIACYDMPPADHALLRLQAGRRFSRFQSASHERRRATLIREAGRYPGMQQASQIAAPRDDLAIGRGVISATLEHRLSRRRPVVYGNCNAELVRLACSRHTCAATSSAAEANLAPAVMYPACRSGVRQFLWAGMKSQAI